MNSLFTDGGGRLLLTQAGSPRYSVQDDGVLSLLFVPWEQWCQMYRKGNLLIREGLPSRSHDKVRPEGMFSMSNLNSKITCRIKILSNYPHHFLLTGTHSILSFGHIGAIN